MQKKLALLYVVLCCFHVAVNGKMTFISRKSNLVKADAIPEATSLESHRVESVSACLAKCKDGCRSVNFGEQSCMLYADNYTSDADVWKEMKGFSHYTEELPEMNKIITTEPTTTPEETTTTQQTTTLQQTTTVQATSTLQETTSSEMTTTLPETTTIASCDADAEETCDSIAVKLETEFIASQKTFEDAQKECAKKNKKLVVVDSKRKSECLSEYLNKHHCPGNVWIGLRWNKAEKNYQWPNQAMLLDDCQFWALGEPEARGEADGECIEVSKSKSWGWIDSSCTRTSYILCQNY